MTTADAAVSCLIAFSKRLLPYW